MNQTLLRCPFCGAAGHLDKTLCRHTDQTLCEHDDHVTDVFAYFVICRSCAARGGWDATEAGAVRWWNQREPTP